uniref:Tubby-related protein 4 n=1 Tax=Oncorhynchus mykiss TaxID=8022 RepID=A0A8C7U813_ONCMY
MLAAVEHGPILCSDSNILCLSWKGRVPKSEKDKPVCQRRYYEEGWLATGNGRGVVGVTFTSSHCRRDRNTPQRINFNLRGHNSEVVLVRWNEPFQKLATCDMEGGIFVWIQYEGRWSVELVNDRGAQVSDFTWSHDGSQALIAYRDGFVLVGSVSGQRHWSSEINLESQITCGIWTPDDQQVLFGTADGQVIVMDCHGRMIAHVLLHESDGIVGMSWNCPCFLVEDSTESDTDSDDNNPPQVRNLKPLLTVSFISGDISLMNNYDDLAPTVIRSGLKDVEVQWCSQGDLLAVAGMERHGVPGLPSDSIMRNALVKFYNVQGEHIYTLETPAQRPITTICWGHRDSRLFLACGPALYVVRVEHRVASLQLLCQQGIASALREERDVGKLNMPSLLCSYVTTAFIPTIKPPIPDPNNIRDFVSYPTAGNERLHCTMKRAEDNPGAGGPCYTLYLEHLGGLVPILKGRRISKLRPEFIIMDPKTDSKADEVCVNAMISYMTDSCNCSDSSDIELSDEWVGKKSPKLSRGNRSPKHSRRNMESRKSPKTSRTSQEGLRSPRLPTKKPLIRSPSLTRREMSMDGISEHNYLAQVTSNIWGTKFKIVGLASFLPANLGAVIYKTSLLHLQPRQMTIYLPEVRRISLDFMSLPVFNPNVFSEDEDDLPVTGPSGVTGDNPPCTVNIPIAPIHSPAQAMSPTQSIGLVQSLLANQNIQLDVLTNPTATASAAAADAVAVHYSGTLGRYSNPGQVIFNGLEMGPLLAGTLPPPPPPHNLPQQPHQQRPQTLSFIDTDTLRSRPPSFLDAETSLEIQMRKVNAPPPYPGTVVSAATATTSTAPQTLITNCDNPNILVTVDPCLKKDEFSLHPVGLQYQMGYERITTFDSSGNVEEVCRPRRRLIRNQNAYAVQGMGGSATLKVTSSSDSKKIHLPYSSATLSRLSVPRYSIPSGDPPPYPDPANQVNINTTTLPPPQRMDSSHMIHATLRRDRRDGESRLKVSQMVDASRTLPSKSKINSAALALSYQQRVPTALYTCTQCSSNSSSTSVSVSGGGSSSSGIAGGTVVRQDFPPGKGAHHSTIIVHSKSTSPLASQSSYNLLSPIDNSRDRTVYVNSAFTEDEALSQQCRHLTLGEVSLTLKRPPPYQWDPNTAEEFWIPQEQTILAPPPPPTHKPPPPLIFSNAQHLDMTRLPFLLSTKPPSSPSTVTFPSGYQISLSPFPPGGGQGGPPLQSIQSPPPPCPPNEVVAPVPQFTQQDPNLVLPPGYPPNLANLACCPLPPMYPGASSCAGLQLQPVSLHPWNPYSLPMQDPSGSATLPSKSHQLLEKPVLSPSPPTELTESASSFQEPSSLNESPVPDRQGTDRFSKKSRKRLDSRAEEANMTTVSEGKSKKEGRALSDFNSLISSPRLGGRDKKKPKGQREQLNKTKKLNRTSTTSEFQDSSESEPELFISGDELMNQSQSSKKGWKSKRSLRMASELEEIKCRKANEREDRGLGSQGFVYVMANKQPLWNEATQVYQLDFGGRVTQESAKNFQIELDGRQVMQFGRIDGNAYILDFQYPFSAVQAFAVALANVTQRLK